jgi:plastocyanin
MSDCYRIEAENMLRRRILKIAALWWLIIAFTSVYAVLPAHAVVDSFTLFGSASSGWGFTKGGMSSPGPTISVLQGDIVNLTLTSADGLTHRFFVDYNGNGIPDPGEPASAPFASTTGFQFNASVAGTFRYYCAFHPGVMSGTFAVQTAGSQAPAVNFGNFGLLALLLVGGAVAVGSALLVILGAVKFTCFRHRKKQ